MSDHGGGHGGGGHSGGGGIVGVVMVVLVVLVVLSALGVDNIFKMSQRLPTSGEPQGQSGVAAVSSYQTFNLMVTSRGSGLVSVPAGWQYEIEFLNSKLDWLEFVPEGGLPQQLAKPWQCRGAGPIDFQLRGGPVPEQVIVLCKKQ